MDKQAYMAGVERACQDTGVSVEDLMKAAQAGAVPGLDALNTRLQYYQNKAQSLQEADTSPGLMTWLTARDITTPRKGIDTAREMVADPIINSALPPAMVSTVNSPETQTSYAGLGRQLLKRRLGQGAIAGAAIGVPLAAYWWMNRNKKKQRQAR